MEEVTNENLMDLILDLILKIKNIEKKIKDMHENLVIEPLSKKRKIDDYYLDVNMIEP